MATIKPNRNFGRDIKREIDAKAQRAVDAVAAQHKGGDQATIKAALDRQLKRIGLPLPDSTLDEWSAILAHGNDIKVDIHPQ